jgi:ATP-dependent RNA helicase DDX21
MSGPDLETFRRSKGKSHWKDFQNGNFGILVATNVAASGLDNPEVDLDVQSCPLNDVGSSIHDSGSTDRDGRIEICTCF